ncbi:MAG: hypothetical protein B6D39_04065 [Anaerolineae bacterium UTCFX2]|jgi:flagellar biosynthesis/type III secretory pathway chaperone|nr:MAG: hypothetical protein B6D39_04065 [Anaerolineae bacterium UTCFX2]
MLPLGSHDSSSAVFDLNAMQIDFERTMTGRPQKSHELFQLMVGEFRGWQALLRLLRRERCLLADCDAAGLVELAQQKSELLAQLSGYRQQRRRIAPDFDVPSVADFGGEGGSPVFANLAEEDAARLARITEGIRTLAWQVGELAAGNYALADCSVRRSWSTGASIHLWAQEELRRKLPAILSELLARPEPCRQFEYGEFLEEPSNALAVEGLPE